MAGALIKAAKPVGNRAGRHKKAGAMPSLAATVRLPYRPTSFKLRDLKRVVAAVKKTQA